MAMTGSYRRRAVRHQRRLAVVATLLWLLGFEVLPNLHLAVHAELAPHDHGAAVTTNADGLRVTVTFGGHRHDDGSWHHHEDDARDVGTTASGEHDGATAPRAPDHGTHSLAHRTLALHAPPPVVTAPLPVTRTLTWIEIARDDAPRSPAAPTAVARGPPVA
jgi:hypothetical protein